MAVCNHSQSVIWLAAWVISCIINCKDFNVLHSINMLRPCAVSRELECDVYMQQKMPEGESLQDQNTSPTLQLQTIQYNGYSLRMRAPGGYAGHYNEI